jgi:large subunit ribosomal protein L10
MPLTRTDKEQMVADYASTLATADHVFVLGFKGITVPQITELRSRIRQKGGYYEVVKNTLALRAVEGKPLGALASHFTGTTAIVYGKDVVGLAKVLTEFAKDVPAIEFKAAMVDNQPVTAAQIPDIAALPSREELIAKLLFLLQSPITRFVRVLAAVPREFVVVLDQIRQKKEGNA